MLQLDADRHDLYPHVPGTLYDCPACEDTCFCDEVKADREDEYREEGDVLECVHCAGLTEAWNADVQRRLGRQSA